MWGKAGMLCSIGGKPGRNRIGKGACRLVCEVRACATHRIRSWREILFVRTGRGGSFISKVSRAARDVLPRLHQKRISVEPMTPAGPVAIWLLLRRHRCAIQAVALSLLLVSEFPGQAVPENFEEFCGGFGLLRPIVGIHAEHFLE